MSMPSIPPEPYRPNRKEVIVDLLESIALEEISLSHLMKAEAEKIQAFVGECKDFPTDPSSEEIIQFNRNMNQFLETIVMKEWILLRKLQNVLYFHETTCDKKHHHHHHHHKHHKRKCNCCCSECLTSQLKNEKCHCHRS
ncbi:hypothetical protein [Halalkalibacillus sediminis]|uniref:hypothetical protein n=1 Tax=Halalkalibacillus sediminis TaxID=2018042 RepID=UPI00192E4DDB|nr:hypothetical protein [Halalkalibacillus sediminis]